MHSQKKIAQLILSFLALLIAYALPAQNNAVVVQFHHVYNNKPIQFDSVLYSNGVNQNFTLSKFKYYISNIRLISSQKKYKKIKNNYLIDEEDHHSKKIYIEAKNNLPYTGIEFSIGVDSANNCSGAQSGSLDPIKGMFWSWNNGYIFVKLEGKSKSASSTGRVIEYHIGGYKSPANNNRLVCLPFKESLSGDQLKGASLLIKVELAEFFIHPINIDFEKIPTVTDLVNATLIADNYKDMFSLSR